MDDTESHAECHFNCECDNSSLSDPKYAQLKGILSDEYEYRLCSFSECPTSGGFTATIRLPLRSKDEAKSWKKEFQECSKSTFRVSKTYPHVGEKVIFKEDLRCQHKTRTECSRLSSKNTKCSATMTISVKRIEKGRCRSKDAHLQIFPMIVNMNFIHNHLLNSADALRHRDVSEEVTKKFLTMFEAGHSPSSALELHKYDMQIDHQDDFIFASADRAKIPDLQWCYRLYHTIAKKAYGNSDLNMMKDLEKLVERLNSEGETIIKMSTSDNQLIVAICTPLMKRVHQMVEQSGEMTFVDSSGNMDRHNLRLFLLMTHSCCGGLPLGCLITSTETESTIKSALELLKSIILNEAFYGRGVEGSIIFMTDDCEAERKALKSAFPKSTPILCVFHVLQAAWRWLWDSKNQIAMKHRQQLFHLVKDMMYADDKASLVERYEATRNDTTATSYPSFMTYVSKLYDRRHLWAVCFRDDMPIRGNNTNNFCEAAMRVLKEKILLRMKAYNALQLVEFVVTRLESFYERRLVDVANNRLDYVRHSKYFPVDNKVSLSDIKQLSSNVYTVPSETKKDTIYTVNTEVGLCTCHIGKNGGPCKHQVAVSKKFQVASLNIIPVTSAESRQLLYKVATGKDVSPEWFTSLWDDTRIVPRREQVEFCENDCSNADTLVSMSLAGSSHEKSHGTESSTSTSPTRLQLQKDSLALQNTVHKQFDARQITRSSSSSSSSSSASATTVEQTTSPEERDGIREDLIAFASKLATKVEHDPDTFKPAVKTFIKSASKLQTDSALISALNTFGKYSGLSHVINNNKKKMRIAGMKQIGVQPTAIARRKRASLGGRKCLSSGRLTKLSGVSEHGYTKQPEKRKATLDIRGGILPPKKKPAAPHNISVCVSRNQSLGKTHSKQ
ncbi:uncharacterized protein LOC135484914 [Lineus longissimus]|uniref:uncharacterized protein LOC135484914 n=1 Tax=Lineus longissimus TaxID=88925 RepID=UPI00315CB329